MELKWNVLNVVICIIGILLICYSRLENFDGMTEAVKKIALEFEVFGKVQGVFFRKYTQEKGRALGLRGCCMNTKQGTVKGELQGDPKKVQEMRYWLSNVGSPHSRIDKAEFKNERQITDCTFSDFEIRR